MSRHSYNVTWFVTQKDGVEELAKNVELKLTSSDFRVLFYTLSKIEDDNKATLPTQTVISEEINISVRKISEAFRRLRDAKILVKSEEVRTYFINPTFFYACGKSRLTHTQKIFDSYFKPKPDTYTPTVAELRNRLFFTPQEDEE